MEVAANVKKIKGSKKKKKNLMHCGKNLECEGYGRERGVERVATNERNPR